MKRMLMLVLALLLCSGIANAGIIGQWSFDGNTNDSVGNRHGTVVGATLIEDRFGNADSAYLFDGIDENGVFQLTARKPGLFPHNIGT